MVSLTRDGDAAEEGQFVVGQEAALRGKQNLKVIFDSGNIECSNQPLSFV